ncbi:MAG TPA: zf-HC2 domain-containing protein [Thermomicrobiales bacterium]|nr:zf-HC2 domain-containing protein [Thermomicrobiales bacterium]
MTAAGGRHAAVADLLPAHALGVLAGRERRAVTRHLATCPACRRDLAGLRATVDLLAYAAPPARPVPAVKDLLLGRLRCAIMR